MAQQQKVKGVSINRDLFPRFLYLVAFGERKGEEVPHVPTVRDYMQQETTAFIAELIRRNASVKNLVDSDFAMLNQRLAAHYGVEGWKATSCVRCRSSRNIISADCSRRAQCWWEIPPARHRIRSIVPCGCARRFSVMKSHRHRQKSRH